MTMAFRNREWAYHIRVLTQWQNVSSSRRRNVRSAARGEFVFMEKSPLVKNLCTKKERKSRKASRSCTLLIQEKHENALFQSVNVVKA